MSNIDKLNEEYWKISEKTQEQIKNMRPISLENRILSKCALILVYYPLNEKKLKIFNKLDQKGKVGLLNRHLLSVASKLKLSEALITEMSRSMNNYRSYKKYNERNDDFWNRILEKNEIIFNKVYKLFLDSIIEEIDKRKNIKYLRNKKLNEILDK